MNLAIRNQNGRVTSYSAADLSREARALARSMDAKLVRATIEVLDYQGGARLVVYCISPAGRELRPSAVL